MVKGQKTVEDVIEALGFGQAQLRNLLAYGIWFVEGAQIHMASNLVEVMAADLHLTKAQQASLSSLIFVGIAVGSLLGGYMSDRIGRVPPLMLCFLVSTLSQLLTAFVRSYIPLVILRLEMGFGLGLGMAPSLALVNETTPVSQRVMLQGVRSLIFVAGQIFAALIFIADSPASIMGLHWRPELAISTLAFAVLGLIARCCLYDSPVFLAHTGRHKESVALLTMMRHINGKEGLHFASIEYDSDEPPEGGEQHNQRLRGDCMEELSVVFGRHLLWITLVLMWGSVMANLLLFGHLYAFPKILKSVESTMMPGHQSLMQALVAVATHAGVMAFAVVTSCRSTLVLAGLLGVVGPTLLAWTASLEGRTGFQDLLYLAAQNMPGIAAACAFLASFQCAVDLYPVRVKATSAAVVVASGRFAGIVAPFLCEAMGSWKSFYELMSVLSLVLVVFTGAVLFRSLPTTAEATPLGGRP